MSAIAVVEALETALRFLQKKCLFNKFYQIIDKNSFCNNAAKKNLNRKKKKQTQMIATTRIKALFSNN